MPSDQPLGGRTIGVTAERRAEDQAVLFKRLGAEVVLGPTIHTSPTADQHGLRSVTEDLIGNPPDYLIANTGMGMRAWMAAASGWELEQGLRAALNRTRIAARGPKAAGALSSSKLEMWWRSPSEQLAEVAAHLEAAGISGKRVALQLHGDDQADLVSTLEAAGAEVITVPVYRWSIPQGDQAEAALALIDGCRSGAIDAVTFTAGPQVRNMFALAEQAGGSAELREAFGRHRPLAACIGPVCAGVAREEGIEDPLVPENWRLGSLVKSVAAALQNH